MSTCYQKRKTIRGEEEKKRLLHRLKRMEGQLRGMERMLEEDCYCNDILIQSAAVGAALNAFNRQILAGHMRSCVARDLREGKAEVIDEFLLTLAKMMK